MAEKENCSIKKSQMTADGYFEKNCGCYQERILYLMNFITFVSTKLAEITQTLK